MTRWLAPFHVFFELQYYYIGSDNSYAIHLKVYGRSIGLDLMDHKTVRNVAVNVIAATTAEYKYETGSRRSH